MLNFNEEDLKAAVVQKAADELLKDSDDLSVLVGKEVKARLDKIFAERATAQISAAIDEAIRYGFEREYQRIDQWGEAKGAKTTIKAELAKIVDGYWNGRVNKKNGQPSDSTYDSVSRAEYLMTQICAQDFSESLKAHATNVTGALKDGLRNQLAAQMNMMLDGLFHVKSLQDQGKVEKPY